MSGIRHVDFMGKSIIYIDFEGAASDFEVIDLGQKASNLVKLCRRNEVLVLYNLTGLQFTRMLMQNMKQLMAHSALVTRRVIFGADPRYRSLLDQLLQHLTIAPRTRFAEGYVQGLQLICNDDEWRERRDTSRSPGYSGPDRRADPRNPPSAAQVQAAIDKNLPK